MKTISQFSSFRKTPTDLNNWNWAKFGATSLEILYTMSHFGHDVWPPLFLGKIVFFSSFFLWYACLLIMVVIFHEHWTLMVLKLRVDFFLFNLAWILSKLYTWIIVFRMHKWWFFWNSNSFKCAKMKAWKHRTIGTPFILSWFFFLFFSYFKWIIGYLIMFLLFFMCGKIYRGISKLRMCNVKNCKKFLEQIWRKPLLLIINCLSNIWNYQISEKWVFFYIVYKIYLRTLFNQIE